MILHMSNTKGHHGRALGVYLQQVLDAEQSNINAWAIKHNLSGPNVHRWTNDTDPQWDSLPKIAAALGLSMLEVLVIGEWLTPEQAGGLDKPAPAGPGSVLDAIRVDPALNDDTRAALGQIYRQVATQQVKVRNRRSKP